MKKILAALCSLAMMASLVACGGATSGTSEATSGDATTSAAASGKGRTLEEIKDSGKLIVLTNAEFAPYEYLGDDGKPAGVDIDLCQQIADEIGVELEVVNMDFDGLVLALKSGKGDIVASGMSITEERQKQVDFTTPYVDTTLYIVVQEGDTSITSVDDLAGKKVAVQEGTTSDLIVSDIEGVGEVQKYKTSSLAGSALKAGKADVMVMDDLTAQNVTEALGGLTITDIEVSHEQYAMAVNKGSEDFLKVVNDVLQKAVDSDEVTMLITEHMEAAQG